MKKKLSFLSKDKWRMQLYGPKFKVFRERYGYSYEDIAYVLDISVKDAKIYDMYIMTITEHELYELKGLFGRDIYEVLM